MAFRLALEAVAEELTDCAHSLGRVELLEQLQLARRGDLYRQGRGGGARDDERARQLYQESAGTGWAHGQAMLGVMYGRG